jgi:uncharacterized protein YeeX (DUF496 family)
MKYAVLNDFGTLNAQIRDTQKAIALRRNQEKYLHASVVCSPFEEPHA